MTAMSSLSGEGLPFLRVPTSASRICHPTASSRRAAGKMWLGEEGWLYGRVTTDVYSFADVESPETVERIMKLRGNELITDTDRLVSGGQLLEYHARMTRVDREDV